LRKPTDLRIQLEVPISRIDMEASLLKDPNVKATISWKLKKFE
jgi:hypothetical protein